MPHIENLKELVPYNVFIGDLSNPDDHLVEVEEEWRDVPGLPYYRVSSFGRVHSLDKSVINGYGTYYIKKGKLRALRRDKAGYITVGVITAEQKEKWVKVHRLVGFAFIDNPLKLPQINHLDRIKSNNRPYNLQWCSASQNTLHKFQSLCPSPKNKASIAVYVTNKNSGERIFFVSQGCAARYFKVTQSCIHRAHQYGYNLLNIYRVELA